MHVHISLAHHSQRLSIALIHFHSALAQPDHLFRVSFVLQDVGKQYKSANILRIFAQHIPQNIGRFVRALELYIIASEKQTSLGILRIGLQDLFQQLRGVRILSVVVQFAGLLNRFVDRQPVLGIH